MAVRDLDELSAYPARANAAAWAETFENLLLTRAERTGERLGQYTPFNPRTDYGA